MFIGELPTTTRKIQAVRQAVGNLNQKQMEKSEVCGSSQGVEEVKEEVVTSENTRTHREVDEDANRPGCQSKHWTSEDRREELFVIR